MRLRMWNLLREHGPMTSEELGLHTGLGRRAVNDYMCAMRKSGYVRSEAASAKKVAKHHAIGDTPPPPSPKPKPFDPDNVPYGVGKITLEEVWPWSSGSKHCAL